MSEKDKAEIMEALSGLPEEKKQFVLGYAAGVAAKTEPNGGEQNGDRGDRNEAVQRNG